MGALDVLAGDFSCAYVGVCVGCTLDSNVSFLESVGARTLGSVEDSFSYEKLYFLNAGRGVACCRILAISMNASVVSFSYVNLGIFYVRFCNISIISEAACFKFLSGLMVGNSICYGRNLILSKFVVHPVAGV